MFFRRVSRISRRVRRLLSKMARITTEWVAVAEDIWMLATSATQSLATIAAQQPSLSGDVNDYQRRNNTVKPAHLTTASAGTISQANATDSSLFKMYKLGMSISPPLVSVRVAVQGSFSSAGGPRVVKSGNGKDNNKTNGEAIAKATGAAPVVKSGIENDGGLKRSAASAGIPQRADTAKIGKQTKPAPPQHRVFAPDSASSLSSSSAAESNKSDPYYTAPESPESSSGNGSSPPSHSSGSSSTSSGKRRAYLLGNQAAHSPIARNGFKHFNFKPKRMRKPKSIDVFGLTAEWKTAMEKARYTEMNELFPPVPKSSDELKKLQQKLKNLLSTASSPDDIETRASLCVSLGLGYTQVIRMCRKAKINLLQHRQILNEKFTPAILGAVDKKPYSTLSQLADTTGTYPSRVKKVLVAANKLQPL